MVQVIQRTPTGLESVLGSLGTGIGSGLQTGLQALANLRLSEMQQRAATQRGIPALQALGFQPEQAQALAGLDPKILQDVVKQRLAAPQQAAYLQALQGLMGAPTEGAPAAGQAEQIPSILGAPGLTAQQATKLTELALRKKGLEAKEKVEERRIKAQEEKATQAETKAYVQDVNKEQKAAKEANLTLEKMEQLIEKGKLPPAAMYKLIKDIEDKVPPTYGAAAGAAVGTLIGGPAGAAIGGGIGALVSPVASLAESAIRGIYPDTEEFEKLSNSFIRGAKSFFGSRVTDLDLKAFLATIPNLTQTEQGKKKIINNLKVFNDAALARYNAMKKVLKETGGKRPADFQFRVEEEADKELDKLAKRFLGEAAKIKAETQTQPEIQYGQDGQIPLIEQVLRGNVPGV